VSKHRQQQWVARQPGGKFGAPMENTAPAQKPPVEEDPPVAFMPAPTEEPPADAEYMGDVPEIPENLKEPIRVLRHDRLTKDGVTWIVIAVADEKATLMSPKGMKTVDFADLGDYQR